jgi:hypothetical protein
MTADPFNNLAPMRPRLTDRGAAILGMIERADELSPVLDRDYIIKGWLDAGALAVLYGDANAGKSFVGVDIAHHVHEGRRWGGNRVAPGPVLYVAAEGGGLFQNRLAARGARFHVLRHQIALAGRNPDAAPLAQAVNAIAVEAGPFRLIIVDTLARAMGGGDENAAPDIGALVAACGHVQKATGAAVLLIHHSGKDATRGARGHSALRAAVDTELCLTVGDDGWRVLSATKQRDWPGGKELRFKLAEVQLGKDGDGDPVTSCIVQHENREGALNL